MLQPNHIQHYPIGGEKALRVTYRDNIARLGGILEAECLIHLNKDSFTTELKNIKPLLRPMSDLYKERNGKTDIVELAKIAGYTEDEIKVVINTSTGEKTCIVIDNQTIYGKYREFRGVFSYEKGDKAFCFEYNDSTWESEYSYSVIYYAVPNQLALFQYLFENHYDVFGLIEKGLAIDINT